MVMSCVLRKTTKPSIVKKLGWLISLIRLNPISFMKLVEWMRLWIINRCFGSIGIIQLSLSPSVIQLPFYVINLEESLLIIVVRYISWCPTHYNRVICAHRLHPLSSGTSMISNRLAPTKHTCRSLTAAALHFFILNHFVSFYAPSQTAICSWSVVASRCLNALCLVESTFVQHHLIIAVRSGINLWV